MQDIFTVFFNNDLAKPEYRILVFQGLTNNGRTTNIFRTEDVVECIVHLFRGNLLEASSDKTIEECLNFLTRIVDNLVKPLDEGSLCNIIDSCSSLIKTRNVEVLRLCLNIFDALMKKQNLFVIPSKSLNNFCYFLCQTINFHELVEQSWNVMSQLLQGKIGQRVFQLLCDILFYSDIVFLHRGATFFVGMAAWGGGLVTQKQSIDIAESTTSHMESLNSKNSVVASTIEGLKINVYTILKAFDRLVSLRNPIVLFEILLTLKRLLSGCNNNDSTSLSFEWPLIVEILSKMKAILKTAVQSSQENTKGNPSNMSNAINNPTKTTAAGGFLLIESTTTTLDNNSTLLSWSNSGTGTVSIQMIKDQLIECLSTIVSIYEKGKYFGEDEALIYLLEQYEGDDVQLTLRTMTICSYRINPSMTSYWKSNFNHFLEVFFAKSNSQLVKLKALEMSKKYLMKSRLYAEDILEELLIVFGYTNTANDEVVSEQMVLLIVDVLKESLSSKKIGNLCSLLEKFILYVQTILLLLLSPLLVYRNFSI